VKVTKFTHSCVRLEKDGRVLVIDPGVWSEHTALRGADAVLVTHGHGDHVDVLRVAGAGVPVYAPAGAELPGLSPTFLSGGETRDVAGFAVTAVGVAHAAVHKGLPSLPHLGYLVDDLYHPGDSVRPPGDSVLPPGVDVATLLVPMQASWLKTSEAMDLIRAVDPALAIGIHEGQLNDRGIHAVNGWLGQASPRYRYVPPGEAVR